MRHRFPAAALIALTATLLLAGTAFAGGWANAIKDDGPLDPPNAGVPITIGFTLLQHGVTPVDGGSTNVTVRNPATGEELTVAARRDGPSGHWVAVITFPSDGTWRYEVTTTDLEVGMMGFNPVIVGSGAAGNPASPATSATTAQPLILLLFALVLTLAVAGAFILAQRRRAISRTARA
jgi:hypothetical protein